MVLDIIKEGDERLTAANAEVANLEDVKELIDNLKDTLLKADENGLGLAAPQVGVNVRVLVMKEGIESRVTPLRMKPLFAMINPVITKKYPKTVFYREGCLSVVGKVCDVERYKEIKVRYMNEQGKYVTIRFEGVDAVVAQHEIDHLNGIVMTDSSRARRTINVPSKEAKIDPPAEKDELSGQVVD